MKSRHWYECTPQKIGLTEEEAEKIVDLLENPPKPNEALKRLFRRHPMGRKIQIDPHFRECGACADKQHQDLCPGCAHNRGAIQQLKRSLHKTPDTIATAFLAWIWMGYEIEPRADRLVAVPEEKTEHRKIIDAFMEWWSGAAVTVKVEEEGENEVGPGIHDEKYYQPLVYALEDALEKLPQVKSLWVDYNLHLETPRPHFWAVAPGCAGEKGHIVKKRQEIIDVNRRVCDPKIFPEYGLSIIEDETPLPKSNLLIVYARPEDE